jgi:hypothetical protein
VKDKASGIFKRMAASVASGRGTSPSIAWQPDSARYPRLLSFDPQPLVGRSGLYLLWHLGVRPQWLRVGSAKDLGAAAAHLSKTPEVAAFIPHDGPFLSWAFCAQDVAPALVNFLAARLNPALQDLVLVCDMTVDSAVAPVACPLPPGTKDIQTH